MMSDAGNGGGGRGAKADHFLIDGLPDSDLSFAHHASNMMKISRVIGAPDPLGDGAVRSLERVSEAYELAAVEQWPGPAGGGGGENFRRTCAECFALMEECPLPADPVQRAAHVLRAAAYAYMGEKWEDARRYVKRTALPAGCDGDDDDDGGGDGDTDAPDGWERRLLFGIYGAILLAIRKDTPRDLAKAAGIIADLRREQADFEAPYFESLEPPFRAPAAHRVAALYHLAKCTDLLCGYMARGSPADIEARLGYHFDKALQHCGGSASAELDVLLRIIRPMFAKMVGNSVWEVAKRVNSSVAQFVDAMAKSDRPILELLYPQQRALFHGGLLDPTSRAVAVSLPTSSGKTLLAEFKILQAIGSPGSGARIAYVAPTRTLVNQIAARLRRDLGADPLGIKVEKATGAVEIDEFERSLLSGSKPYDVLVTTPEKLLLMVRDPGGSVAESLALCIVDEAHNMGAEAAAEGGGGGGGEDAEGEGGGGAAPEGPSRGLTLELLLATVKRECQKASLLLMTPFVRNISDVAKWLDPRSPRSVNVGLEWRPNDRVVGVCYARGRGRKIEGVFEPLATCGGTVVVGGEISVGTTPNFSVTASKVARSRHMTAALLATQVSPDHNFLVLARTVRDAWRTAGVVYDNVREVPEVDGDLDMARRFVASELGEKFPLARYLGRGIGVHHAGLPDDVRHLMEVLMESGRLRTLVATTTIAQGINFPVSGILVSSYHYPRKRMPHGDFWNLIGRAGRINQPSLGMVGIAVDGRGGSGAGDAKEYVMQAAGDLTSELVRMVGEAAAGGGGGGGRGLDLRRLAGDPRWSSFAQYVAHLRNRAKTLGQFAAESEIALRQTYGYGKLGPAEQDLLLGAVRRYGRSLDERPGLSHLADVTGFSPETVEGAIGAIPSAGIGPLDWNPQDMFSRGSGKISRLVGVMLGSIPEVGSLSGAMSGPRRDPEGIGALISDWVSGKSITAIAAAHFGGTGEAEITACVRALYQRVASSASWGLAGIQKIYDFGRGGQGEGGGGRGSGNGPAANLPAMVYHGVDTDEAVLMRINGVPRSVSKSIGAAYAREFKADNIYAAESGRVLGWLSDLPGDRWRPEGGSITGEECKEVWMRLSGVAG